MQTVAFMTLGCKVNSYETDKMKESFLRAGCRVVDFTEKADVYVINTCTVTNIADRKSRQMLHRAKKKNPDSVIVAAGCYVDSVRKKKQMNKAQETDTECPEQEKDSGQTQGIDREVDVLIPNGDKSRIVEIVQAYLEEKAGQVQGGKSQPEKHCEELCGTLQPEEELLKLADSHTRAYIEIQTGCNQYCSYCIIPYVRGALKSKPEHVAVEEIRGYAQRGYKEVVLTGIHLSSYGVDGSGAKQFTELSGKPLLSVIRGVSGIPGIQRIRLGSLEPRIITEDFARELSEIPGICPHFHLSLQSGCDETLRRMNRKYTTKEYLEKVEILRKYFDNPAITTDVIVGFPGESEEEFATTKEFLATVGFAQMHIFRYSLRQGTMAAGMKGQVPEQEKARRSGILLDLERELRDVYRSDFLGKPQEVLFEEEAEIGGKPYYIGYTTRYVRIAQPVQDAEFSLKDVHTGVFGNVVPKQILSEDFLS